MRAKTTKPAKDGCHQGSPTQQPSGGVPGGDLSGHLAPNRGQFGGHHFVLTDVSDGVHVGLSFRLVLDKGRLVLHHGVHSQLLVILGRDDGDGRLLTGGLHRHLLDHLHLCKGS